MPGNACVGNNGATTDWAYVSQRAQPPYPRRTASLSRNLTRRSRSVTMPNMKEENGTAPVPSPSPSSSCQNNKSSTDQLSTFQQFSTFKQTNNTVGFFSSIDLILHSLPYVDVCMTLSFESIVSD